MSVEFMLEELRRLENRLEQLESVDSVAVVCAAGRGAVQAIASATGTVINFDTNEIDTRTAITTSPNWRFVAPVGGYYAVSGCCALTADAGWAAGENASLYVLVNGTIVKYLATCSDVPAGGSPTLSGAVDILVSKNDYIQLGVFQVSGNVINIIADTKQTWIAVHRIRGY